MVLVYIYQHLYTRTKSPSFVGKYIIHGAYGYVYIHKYGKLGLSFPIYTYIHIIYIYMCKYESQLGLLFTIYGKRKAMFQTTKQYK